jgi:hypothetical protein
VRTRSVRVIPLGQIYYNFTRNVYLGDPYVCPRSAKKKCAVYFSTLRDRGSESYVNLVDLTSGDLYELV